MRENRQFHKAAVTRDSAALIHADFHRDNVGAEHRDHTSYRAATGTRQIISKHALTWFLVRDPQEMTKYKRSHCKGWLHIFLHCKSVDSNVVPSQCSSLSFLNHIISPPLLLLSRCVSASNSTSHRSLFWLVFTNTCFWFCSCSIALRNNNVFRK